MVWCFGFGNNHWRKHKMAATTPRRAHPPAPFMQSVALPVTTPSPAGYREQYRSPQPSWGQAMAQQWPNVSMYAPPPAPQWVGPSPYVPLGHGHPHASNVFAHRAPVTSQAPPPVNRATRPPTRPSTRPQNHLPELRMPQPSRGALDTTAARLQASVASPVPAPPAPHTHGRQPTPNMLPPSSSRHRHTRSHSRGGPPGHGYPAQPIPMQPPPNGMMPPPPGHPHLGPQPPPNPAPALAPAPAAAAAPPSRNVLEDIFSGRSPLRPSSRSSSVADEPEPPPRPLRRNTTPATARNNPAAQAPRNATPGPSNQAAGQNGSAPQAGQPQISPLRGIVRGRERTPEERQALYTDGPVSILRGSTNHRQRVPSGGTSGSITGRITGTIYHPPEELPLAPEHIELDWRLKQQQGRPGHREYTSPCIAYDLSRDPRDPRNVLDIRRPRDVSLIGHHDIRSPASVHTVLNTMTIRAKHIHNGGIRVERAGTGGLRVLDVLKGIYDAYNVPLDIEELYEEDREALIRELRRRLPRSALSDDALVAQHSQGLRRFDLLGRERAFDGLWRNSQMNWDLHFKEL
ncbi:hypothetical protein MIND_00804500 [Mycena indigotica]|uniref:DUF6699 domain-containing protein n=1 Tax=Mycena indigotica TaxID=2126181 RepID=A0A8H6W1U8_9AGAR|nr:uncharacterized protein MIND_00804500 [Mycena indigotica]KAF7298578.1 hypothetical protein MIND_00804500 [Mycena indigotica]